MEVDWLSFVAGYIFGTYMMLLYLFFVRWRNVYSDEKDL